MLKQMQDIHKRPTITFIYFSHNFSSYTCNLVFILVKRRCCSTNIRKITLEYLFNNFKMFYHNNFFKKSNNNAN